MRCPFCKIDNDRVVDSRLLGNGDSIRRRRQCLRCRRRFTTYERIETSPRFVVKKDQRREFFNRDKILAGMVKACEKRNISTETLESIAARLESEIFEEYDREVSSAVIGEKVSEALKELDHVAYVRFASVYRRFTDVRQFLPTLRPLLSEDVIRRMIDPEALEECDGAAGGVEVPDAACPAELEKRMPSASLSTERS